MISIPSRCTASVYPFYINIVSPNQNIYRKSNTFSFSNENLIVITPKQWCHITFNIIVTTSIPTTCIIYAESMVQQLYNISHQTSFIKDNDEYFYINLYNNTDNVIIIPASSIQFSCVITNGNLNT